MTGFGLVCSGGADLQIIQCELQVQVLLFSVWADCWFLHARADVDDKP